MKTKKWLQAVLKILPYVLTDALCVLGSTFVVLTLLYSLFGLQEFLLTEPARVFETAGATFFFIFCFFQLVGVYRCYWRTANFSDFARLFFASLLVLFPMLPLAMFPQTVLLLPSHVFFIVVLSAIAVCGYRLILHSIHRLQNKSYHAHDTKSSRNLLIVGAGEAGRIVVRDIYNNPKLRYKVIGYADDDPSKQGRLIEQVPVVGRINDIPQICAAQNVTDILFAIPSMDSHETQKILDLCNKTNCKIKTVPSIDKILVSGSHNFSKRIRNIEIEDLLPRSPIVLDNAALQDEMNGKVIMVTGGGGSIGSELCKQIAVFSPALLLIVDIYENNAYDLTNELHYLYPDLNIKTLIASVRDKARMNAICQTYKPHIIFHAAAHKHVPLMEDSPCEAIKNNVFGTKNMVECAHENGVPKFVMISTDKAVNPTNIMGASKRLCEILVQSYQQISQTNFVAVRFGNVLGSNGSVIPLFKRQIERGGPVTLTHRDITRFFMTIPEAAQLVLQASLYAKGGEIFVLDMGQPVKIYDLAVNLIKLSGFTPYQDIDIQITGLRPGEKLFEELLMAEEGLGQTAHNKIFVGRPAFTSLHALSDKLTALYDAAQRNDAATTKELLMELVPTFTPVEN